MKPETTADLIAALNNSAAVHDYGQKDDTKTPPPPDSIPCTLTGDVETDDEQTEGEASEEPADTMDHDEEEETDTDEENQKDKEPSKSDAEKEAKEAARWHDYARAFASNCAYANCAALAADALLAAFKSRFPNA